MSDPVRMPSGQGGLVRYTEESTTKLKFSPATIVAIAILIMAIIILLNVFGMKIFT
ncbi:preprotein translocase subunit Sec61beta [Candidatus Woesearchaeota archaeon]|nr:preprotein translocase subunit Sec61beta [Candidatus Woesearchaeota archaeon]